MKGVSKINVTEDISLVTFNNIPRDLNLTAKILTEFSAQGINIDMISQSAPVGATANVSFTAASSSLLKTLEIINSYREAYPSIRPLVSDCNCKIQLFGQEMRDTPGVAAEAFSVVSGVSNEIMLITTSEVDISILLPRHSMQEAVDSLTAHFGLNPPN